MVVPHEHVMTHQLRLHHCEAYAFHQTADDSTNDLWHLFINMLHNSSSFTNEFIYNNKKPTFLSKINFFFLRGCLHYLLNVAHNTSLNRWPKLTRLHNIPYTDTFIGGKQIKWGNACEAYVHIVHWRLVSNCMLINYEGGRQKRGKILIIHSMEPQKYRMDGSVIWTRKGGAM